VGGSVPAVKIPYKVEGLSMRCPLAVGPTLTDRVYMNAVVLVTARKFDNTSGVVCDGLKRCLVTSMAPLDYFRIGLQPGFLIKKSERSRHKKLGLETGSEIREKGWKWKKKSKWNGKKERLINLNYCAPLEHTWIFWYYCFY
jgi:hypothetical protein